MSKNNAWGWDHYPNDGFYDELLDQQGQPHPHAASVVNYLASLSDRELKKRQAAAETAIRVMGISFVVYNNDAGVEREWPFDIVPRILLESEWRQIELGLKQRMQALNRFIDDVYHEQNILNDGVVPRALIEQSPDFLPECMGVDVERGVWAHICGSDLVRDSNGQVYVLEDNLRVPSGVSYVLENREVTKRVFPDLFAHHEILPVDDYPSNLDQMLKGLFPSADGSTKVVVLTPGTYNSAYFEHSYLAQQMGAELVEGRDMVVEEDNCVYVRTITGLERVHVIYRRIDDQFIDPEVFNPHSALGVPGLMRAWKAGNVAIANAPGAGVADDKLIYTYVPDIIRYYLGEEPLIANVPSWRCDDPEQRQYVLDNLSKLVVKPANESGGYGIVIGPQATKRGLAACAKAIKDNPRNYMAQPTLSLSTAPTLDSRGRPVPRHVDLRPFIVAGDPITVTPGGLTRVAMRAGSLIVNSSQGGGSKDTWILASGSHSDKAVNPKIHLTEEMATTESATAERD